MIREVRMADVSDGEWYCGVEHYAIYIVDEEE
jgi:hypothetical protein